MFPSSLTLGALCTELAAVVGLLLHLLKSVHGAFGIRFTAHELRLPLTVEQVVQAAEKMLEQKEK